MLRDSRIQLAILLIALLGIFYADYANTVFPGVAFGALLAWAIFFRPPPIQTYEPVEIRYVEIPEPKNKMLALIALILIAACGFMIIWFFASSYAKNTAITEYDSLANRYNALLDSYCFVVQQVPDGNIPAEYRAWGCPSDIIKQNVREIMVKYG